MATETQIDTLDRQRDAVVAAPWTVTPVETGPLFGRRHVVETSEPGHNETEDRARNLLEKTGLPLSQISAIRYVESAQKSNVVTASYTPATKEIKLHDRFETIDRVKQFGVMVHEGTHSVSAYRAENKHLYRSDDEMAEVRNRSNVVAQRSMVTGKFLNEYHQGLYGLLQRGQIGLDRFYLETEAIMAQLAASDLEHLGQVGKDQTEMIQKLSETKVKVGRDQEVSVLDLRTAQIHQQLLRYGSEGIAPVGNHQMLDTSQPVDLAQYANANLLAVMPQFTDAEALQNHFKQVRASL